MLDDFAELSSGPGDQVAHGVSSTARAASILHGRETSSTRSVDSSSTSERRSTGKCSGLDSAGLAATVGASSMTLGGMLKHLALVEDWWFSQVPARPASSEYPWGSVDFEADPDWEWRTARDDAPDTPCGVGGERRTCANLACHRTGHGWARPGGPMALGSGHLSEHSMDCLSHDRGVRPAQRSRRSASRVDRRSDGRVIARSGSPARASGAPRTVRAHVCT